MGFTGPRGSWKGGEMGCGIHKNGTRVGIHKKGAVGRGGGAENGIMPHKNGTTVGKLFFFSNQIFCLQTFYLFLFFGMLFDFVRIF